MGLENRRPHGLQGASAAALQKGLASLDSESLSLRFTSQRLTDLRSATCESVEGDCTPKCTLDTTSAHPPGVEPHLAITPRPFLDYGFPTL